MIFRVQPPSPPLRRHVEFLWYHEGFVSDYAMERLLPDGAIELIVDLTDPAKRWNDGDDLRRVHTVRRSWISGQHLACRPSPNGPASPPSPAWRHDDETGGSRPL